MSAPRTRLSEQAITALKWIIMTALIGIIAINIIGTLVSAGLLEGLFNIAENPDRSLNTDEALSILGNLGSAAVGGLVGWLTRDYIEASDAADRAAEVAIAEAEEQVEEIEEAEGAPDPSETESVKDESIDEELVTVEDELVEDELDEENETLPPGPDEEYQDDALDAPNHPDELDDEEDPDLTWDDEPKDEEEEATR